MCVLVTSLVKVDCKKCKFLNTLKHYIYARELQKLNKFYKSNYYTVILSFNCFNKARPLLGKTSKICFPFCYYNNFPKVITITKTD